MNIWCENSPMSDIPSGRRRNRSAEGRHAVPAGTRCDGRCRARPAASAHRLRIFWRALPGPVVFCSSSCARLRWVAASVPPAGQEPTKGVGPH